MLPEGRIHSGRSALLSLPAARYSSLLRAPLWKVAGQALSPAARPRNEDDDGTDGPNPLHSWSKLGEVMLGGFARGRLFQEIHIGPSFTSKALETAPKSLSANELLSRCWSND